MYYCFKLNILNNEKIKKWVFYFFHPIATSFLCKLICARKLDIIFLCETIAYNNKIDEIRAYLRYDCTFIVDCIGRSGGLCVLCKFASVCDVVSYSQNHVDLLIHDVEGPWRFRGFYGYPERNRRRLSWGLLRQLEGTNTVLWICMGDFNDLLSVDDKKGSPSSKLVVPRF